MTKYERYTSKDGATLTMSQWGGSPAELELYRKLAEIEDKIDNGTLIELPCKVGDTVWEVCYDIWCVKPIMKTTVANLHTIARWIEDGAFGKSIFLTKAEAEAKWRELKGERE